MYYKVTPCLYKTASMKKAKWGLYIHRRKTNEFKILDKDLNEVHGVQSLETAEHTRGCAFFNLTNNPYLHNK